MRTLEERLLETKGQLAQAVSQNEKLTYTLREAREHIAALREEVDKLTQPPSAYGTLLGRNDDGTVDVFSGGRKMRVAVHPDLDDDELAPRRRGRAQRVAQRRAGPRPASAPARSSPSRRSSRTAAGHDRRPRRRGAGRRARRRRSGEKLRAGDTVLMDPRSGLLLEKLPRPEVEELVLEEVPDISYDDVGGLDDQIEQITDAVELPFLHQDLFAEYKLPAPKGILLYGPPGCGKTLIAKAVANSLAKKVAEVSGDKQARSYFLNIKGPELLNKYVGETERQIRLVFQRAREKSEEGWPVIVFFDEMDSLFRTRGTGISSDMESTIVPAAARRDRRRRDAEERHRDRRLQPRGPHRPGHPAPRPPRREDQDRAARTRRPRRRSSPATSPPTCRSTPTRSQTLGGGDPDKAVRAMIEHTVAEMYRDDEAQPVPRGHLPER